MRQKHKRISILLLLAMVIQIFTPFMNNVGYAEGGTELEVTIDKLELKEQIGRFIKFDLDWSLDPNTEVSEGDYFYIELGENLSSYPVILGDQIKGIHQGDGKYKFTIPKSYDGKTNVKGNFWAEAEIDMKNLPEDGENKTVEIAGKIIEVKDDSSGNIGSDGKHPKHYKGGHPINVDSNGKYYIDWYVSLASNPEDKIIGYTFEDKLQQGLKLDKENVKVVYYTSEENQIYENQENLANVEVVEVDGHTLIDNISITYDKISFSIPDNRRFEAGNEVNYTIYLTYRTYITDLSLDDYSNIVRLSSENDEDSGFEYTVKWGTGGSDSGQKKPDLGTGKFNIIKLDKDSKKPLEGAKFDIFDINGKVIEQNLTTNKEGKFDEDIELTEGTYLLVETKTPNESYKKPTEPIEFTIKGNEDELEKIIEVENEKYKTDIKVEKKWLNHEGKELDPEDINEIQVQLLANNEAEIKTISLNKENNWKGTFKDLPKYDDDGNEIKYIVEEYIEKDGELAEVTQTYENKTGYTLEVEGSVDEGFTLTNTKVEEKTPEPSDLKLKKVDSKNSDKVLQDAKFTLTELEEVKEEDKTHENKEKSTTEHSELDGETTKKSDEHLEANEVNVNTEAQDILENDEVKNELEGEEKAEDDVQIDTEDQTEQDTNESDIDTEDNKEETDDQEVVDNNEVEDEVVDSNEPNKEDEDNEVTEDKTDVIEVDGTNYKKSEKPIELTTGNNGIAKLENIENGLYILEETKAPTGYKKLKEGIIIEIEDGNIKIVGENDNKVACVIDEGLTLLVKNNPEPTDPEPTDPEPTDPEPTDPEPTDPEPTDPKPTEPTDPKPGIPVEPDNPEPTDPEEPEEPEIPEVPEEEEPEEPEEDVGGVIVEPEDPEEPELPEEEEEPEVPEEEEPVKPEEDVAGVVVDREEDKVEDKTPTLPKTGENSTIFLILGLVFIMTGIILKRKIFA